MIAIKKDSSKKQDGDYSMINTELVGLFTSWIDIRPRQIFLKK